MHDLTKTFLPNPSPKNIQTIIKYKHLEQNSKKYLRFKRYNTTNSVLIGAIQRNN